MYDDVQEEPSTINNHANSFFLSVCPSSLNFNAVGDLSVCVLGTCKTSAVENSGSIQ